MDKGNEAIDGGRGKPGHHPDCDVAHPTSVDCGYWREGGIETLHGWRHPEAMSVYDWRSPTGRLAVLVAVPGAAEGWYPEGPGQRPPQRYQLIRDGAVLDDRTVLPLAPWSAFDAVADALHADGWTETAEPDPARCAHGLSLSLCAGPGHYTD